MFHLVRYSILWKVKNFNIFFWPFIFPIILGTLFYIAFGNVKEADFETIPAAVNSWKNCRRTVRFRWKEWRPGKQSRR